MPRDIDQEVRDILAPLDFEGDPAKKVLVVSRSWIPSLHYLLIGLIPLVLLVIVGLPVIGLGLWGSRYGGYNFLSYNLACLACLLPLSFVLMPWGLLQFFNRYQLVWKGKLLMGYRYSIDFNTQTVHWEGKVVLGTELVGIEEVGGKVQSRYGQFRIYANLPGQTTSFRDIGNVLAESQGPIASLFHYGDLVVASAQRYGTEKWEDLRDPRFWMALLIACGQLGKTSKGG